MIYNMCYKKNSKQYLIISVKIFLGRSGNQRQYYVWWLESFFLGRPGDSRIAQANVLKKSKKRSKATVLEAGACLVFFLVETMGLRKILLSRQTTDDHNREQCAQNVSHGGYCLNFGFDLNEQDMFLIMNVKIICLTCIRRFSSVVEHQPRMNKVLCLFSSSINKFTSAIKISNIFETCRCYFS